MTDNKTEASPIVRKARPAKAKRSLFVDLLATSHAVKHALPPVDMRPSFVSRLADELNANVANARAAFVRRQQRREKMRWTVIGAGLAFYFFGLGVALIRIMRWGLSRTRKSSPTNGS
ncbi:MAG: hypothetical protein QF376_02150 [Anaerolineales bacterium]|jgi:hypothetical protein|nr:hypothetical protein [Anaerolineales bacterium]HJO33776.1 hypothetical protein [Anaerolineales bacterium]|tara:strand:+ start:1045 stop:1398 length:354 start_codon:yes stop_codon:yes gene_type:complete